MKFYNLALHKAYFDTGYGLLSYPKYILILGGVGSLLLTDGRSTLSVALIGCGIGFLCYVIGRWCFKSGFVKASIEVSNKYNQFVEEVRNSKIFKEKHPK